MLFFFFKQKTAYDMRISDWSSDVCSSDLIHSAAGVNVGKVGPLSPKKPTIQEQAAMAYTAIYEKEKKVIQKFKEKTRRVTMTTKYTEISSVEKVLLQHQQQADAKAEAASLRAEQEAATADRKRVG